MTHDTGSRHRIRKTTGILFVLILTAMLAACVAERRERTTLDPEPTTQSRTEATAVPIETPTATPSPVPTPSPTPEPTATPEPTPTPKPSPTPEPTPTPEPALAPPYPLACDFTDPELDRDLQEVIEQSLGSEIEGFGVVVIDLTTGARAEVNPDQSYYGASLYKTAVMYEVMRQVEEERLSLDQYVTIDAFYASQDLGTRNWEIGTQITIRDALEASITYSDNATAYLLGDLVGWGQVDVTLAELGATNTHFAWDDLPTTAGDHALLLKAIACARGVTDETSQFMLDTLSGQLISNRLPVYLPDEAIIAHKTGNWPNANHDAGIVYGPDAVYVIAVMSYYPGADERIARLSRDVYEYFHPETFIQANGPIQPDEPET